MGDREVSQYGDVTSDSSERPALHIAGIFPCKTNMCELPQLKSEVLAV